MSTDTTTLKIQRTHPDARMPRYATPGAACFDLHALSVNGAYHIPSVITHGCPVLCGTGLAFEVPSGHVMLIFSRSGHGFRDGIRGLRDDEQRPVLPRAELLGDRLIRAVLRAVDGLARPVRQREAHRQRGDRDDEERDDGHPDPE